MSLVPYGPHNPPTDFDPADYPARSVLTSGTGDAAIMWFDRDPLPFAVDVVEMIQSVFARGGGVVLLARTAEVLARAETGVRMILATAGEWQ